jgi:hypothetical protein
MQYGERMGGHLLSTILMDKDNRESSLKKYFFARRPMEGVDRCFLEGKVGEISTA